MLAAPIPNDSYFASVTKTLVIPLAVIPYPDISRMTLADMLNSTLAYFSHFIDVTITSVPTGLTFNSVCSNGIIINSPCFIIPPDLFNLPSVVKPPAVFLPNCLCCLHDSVPNIYFKNCFGTCLGECDRPSPNRIVWSFTLYLYILYVMIVTNHSFCILYIYSNKICGTHLS